MLKLERMSNKKLRGEKVVSPEEQQAKEDIAQEAANVKVYRASYCDKFGRPVLIMRPSCQAHYPERLGLAILYNPPKIFESFWTLVKPFLESKTYKKVSFVYSEDPQSKKIMETLFDMDNLETAFGGRNAVGFEFEAYSQRMREDDNKKLNSGCSLQSCQSSQSNYSEAIESLPCDSNSVVSDEGDFSSSDETASNFSRSKSGSVDKKTLAAGSKEVQCDNVARSETAVAKEVQ
ncbi:hypothetical protein JRO89_XS04G0099600 [Xanthoceras sorbifolium]|uniref:CRAL-TRIO domain-containing protein n=1 Tax=Xanthoceras sorbifolium TaxID=99658 RepID=A0ABQ8I4Q2_9ROSI|nr:hypothetical protein JRO89_XS04G0099600 [Xanthoceras sorbifolium]